MLNKKSSDTRTFSNEEIALLAVAIGAEKKAEKPIVLDFRNLTPFTEFFTILSASNTRQVYAIAEEIRTFLKTHLKLLPISVDGLESSSWVLLDYGFLFVHIFQESTRETYQLERLWNKAQIINLTEEKCTSLYNEVLSISQDTPESQA